MILSKHFFSLLSFCSLILLSSSSFGQSLLESKNIVSYYEFDGKVQNLANSESPASSDLASPLSFKDGHLYSNGNYSDWYDNMYKQPYLSATIENPTISGFALSITFKLAPDSKNPALRNIIKVEGNDIYFNISRYKEGYIAFEYDDYSQDKDNPTEYVHKLTNTFIPYDAWCNLTVSYNPFTNTIEGYLNGEALLPLPLKESKPKMKYVGMSLTNGSRGSVMLGYVDKISFFDKSLSPNRFPEVYELMVADIPRPKSMIDRNKKINQGSDEPTALLGLEGLTSYYKFENNVDNLVAPDPYLFSVAPPFSYQENALHVNGSYDEYYDYSGDTVIKIPFKENKGNFTLSFNAKVAAETDDKLWGRTITKIAMDDYVLILSRYKEGYLCLEFNYYHDNKIDSRNFVFRNTNIPVGEWFNATLSYNQSSKKAAVYLNGKALNTAPTASFDINNSKVDRAVLTFANRGNGNVFAGSFQRLAIFDRALSGSEVQKLVTNIGASSFSNMLTGPNPVREKTEYEVEQHWTYLPGCVAGDKAKNVDIKCRNGADLGFMISANDAETAFFIIENAFSPALDNSESGSFDACLNKLKRIAEERCGD